MRIDVITAFPGLITGPLEYSIIHRAVTKGLLEVYAHDLRDYTTDSHRQIDDYPFGGGGGMVLKPEPVFSSIEKLRSDAEVAGWQYNEVIYLTPDGDLLTQDVCNELSLKENVILIAGHYKGVDQRVRDALVTREISIGDYVLSGGELPAVVLIDSLARLIPGVLGDAASALTDSFQDDLLDAPVYTRPAEFRGMEVPEVLRSGDHERVEAWREEQRLRKTEQRRPDLLAGRGSGTAD